ncbi:MAG: 2-hydroxychromene-2-carboxylate isomerase [Pseudomonadota bacterium]
MRPKLDFWYEFASTYSYPAALRIEALARERNVDIVWRPFLLGPIFKAQGWESSPFNLFPAKGGYMWRDLERICAAEGLVFRRPEPFPQSSLLAARIAWTDQMAAHRGAYSRRVFQAEFADGARIDDEAVLACLLRSLDLDDRTIIEAARADRVKLRLRRETDEAIRLGLFGAPSFVTADGEIFWGNDRLDAALDWAASKAEAL